MSKSLERQCAAAPSLNESTDLRRFHNYGKLLSFRNSATAKKIFTKIPHNSEELWAFVISRKFICSYDVDVQLSTSLRIITAWFAGPITVHVHIHGCDHVHVHVHVRVHVHIACSCPYPYTCPWHCPCSCSCHVHAMPMFMFLSMSKSMSCSCSCSWFMLHFRIHVHVDGLVRFHVHVDIHVD